MIRPALIDARRDCGLYERLSEQAFACQGDAQAALAFAQTLGAQMPKPGAGDTARLWNVLSAIAAADVTVARAVEPHVDALAILAEANVVGLDRLRVSENSTWGVFAAEAPHASVHATQHGDEWKLSGTKVWCSLAGELSHALVTAHTGEDTRRLFAVALNQSGVTVSSENWHPTGLTAIPSGPVHFDAVEAVPVGADEWYLRRNGFAWGGIGVAACWWGGAVGIARRAFQAASERKPDQIALMHLGAIDVALHAGRVALAAAATEADEAQIDRESAAILALRTRTIVARVAEEVIARVGHALGPAPLALDQDHARRVADLQLYLRQHHAQRDDASLGRKLQDRAFAPW